MNINVYFRTYNAYGGHVTLTLTGGYLMFDAPSFGTALEEIEVVVCFRSDDPPRKSLESHYEAYHAGLAKLPAITLHRKKRTANLSFFSELLTAREVVHSRELSLDLFCNSCGEVVENFELLRKRIRKDDRFDFDGCAEWLDRRLEQLPRTIDELRAIRALVHERERVVRESFTEWERTGIDFDDFHPNARSVVDDPRLWDVSDELSPNGNDTGADVLELYRDWRKQNRAAAESFFQQLMQRWEVRVPPDKADEYSKHTYQQAIVGLAFAQLKLEAKCEPAIAAIALRSIEERPENDLTGKAKAVLEKWL